MELIENRLLPGNYYLIIDIFTIDLSDNYLFGSWIVGEGFNGVPRIEFT